MMIQASERRSSQNFHSWEATFYLLNTLDPPCSGPYKGQVVINSFSNKTKSFSHTNQIISMRLCTSATNKTSTTPRSRICTQNKKCPHLMLKRNIKHMEEWERKSQITYYPVDHAMTAHMTSPWFHRHYTELHRAGPDSSLSQTIRRQSSVDGSCWTVALFVTE